MDAFVSLCARQVIISLVLAALSPELAAYRTHYSQGGTCTCIYAPAPEPAQHMHQHMHMPLHLQVYKLNTIVGFNNYIGYQNICREHIYLQKKTIFLFTAQSTPIIVILSVLQYQP